jgi:hypothetical protein
MFDCQKFNPQKGTGRLRFVDLNRDGSQEVLVAAGYVATQPPGNPEELFCFSSRGRLLWRYRPKIQVEFNTTKDLNGSWRIDQMLVVPENHASSIWVAVNHEFWWPAFVVKLSPSGASSLMFVSSGMIRALLRVQNKSGSYILAGGVNNEYRAASLAVIPVNGPPAISPQSERSEYKCIRGCPSARPYRYFLLPRSELNSASQVPYNWITTIFRRPAGTTIQTLEQPWGGRLDGITGFYGFSLDLQPRSVAYGDSYPEVHKQAENLGWISHSFADCPERRAPALVKIADENGKWSRVVLPRRP